MAGTVRYSTVLKQVARVVSAAADELLANAASCPMRVPYLTVRWRCLVTTRTVVLVTRILLCRIHSVIRIS